MPRRSFVVPFAVSGDKVSIPSTTQSDGTVSLEQGYGFDYERRTDGTDPLAKVFPRNAHNGILNEITASIGEIQGYGFPIWAADSAPYPVNAWVRHDEKVWQNTLSNNSATPGSANSGWASPGATGRVRITSSSTFVVPAGVTTIYVSGTGGGGGGGGGGGRRGSGGRQAGGGGGGGSGRSVISEAISVSEGQSIPVTIGAAGVAGGAGPSNGAGGAGGAGGATTLGTLLSLAGGTGGAGADTISGGPGGSPGGQWGADGMVNDTAGGGGSGGSNPFGTAGGGGRAGANTVVSPGTSGFGYGAGGAGGGGSYAVSAGPGGAGTAGMPGVLIIEW